MIGMASKVYKLEGVISKKEWLQNIYIYIGMHANFKHKIIYCNYY